ncbi:hypothetical protein Bca4012_012063 [Brassica carinata]|uniref:ZF-HD dimerization-type domain-containing protein n=1 Tax=Brassica carinata TaxID=52824 RepID=A0A8X7S3R3_BRACI|nr:hypothetical protein Bca52824_036915 [Brassica carinata]
MDVVATTTTIVSDLDSRQPVIEAPTRIQPAKPISFSNGKRYHDHHQHQVVVTYRECLKNHAAGIGGHALDGCGEFIPSPLFNSSDPTSLTCDACGCHRNFHRREDDLSSVSDVVVPRIEYRPHNRHQLPPPPLPPVEIGGQDNDDPASPRPISSSYMLLALSGGATAVPASRKRFRTKFSGFQKGKMFEFAERVGWRMPKADDDVDVMEFCREIGVERSVFKVWMHNNKTPGRGGARRANGDGGGGDGRESLPTNGSFSSA